MTTSAGVGTVAGGAGDHPQRSHSAAAKRRRMWAAALFLAPALVLLGALVAYPVIFSVWRSFYDAAGTNFLGLGNYVEMFTDPATFTAIRNNVIWVAVVPVTVTILGLIFAVLMERIKWSIAFKLIVFMPMAISMVAAGVIFRTTFQENPQLGSVNAALVGVQQAFGGGAAYPNARPRDDTGTTVRGGAVFADEAVSAGSVQDFALIGIAPDTLPDSATTPSAERCGSTL